MPVIINPYSLETLCAAIGNRLPREDAETLHVKICTAYRSGTFLVLATQRHETHGIVMAAQVERDNVVHALADAADMLAAELRDPPVQAFVEHVSPDGGIISDQGAAAMGKVRR